jgi:hypothetical protein
MFFNKGADMGQRNVQHEMSFVRRRKFLVSLES